MTETDKEILTDKDEIIRRLKLNGKESFAGVEIRNVSFKEHIFDHEVDFSWATFGKGVSFYETIFNCEVRFVGAKFKDNANFEGSKFSGVVNFGHTQVGDKDKVNKGEVNEANFSRVHFNSDVSFWYSEFEDDVCFSRTQFKGKAFFWKTHFKKRVTFIWANFEDRVRFEGVRGSGDEGISVFSREEKTIFKNTHFALPEQALFKQVYLRKTGFLDTDISKTNFTDVDWAESKDIKWAKNKFINWFKWRISHKRNIVYDEVTARKKNQDYALVEKVYRQLKVNFEAKGDYSGAGDFHWGETEMWRMRKSWLRRNVFSFVAWYKYFSGYGERYNYALFWLLVIISALPGLYLLSGMKATTGNDSVEYIFTGKPWDLNLKLLSDYFKAFWYSVHNLTLIRNPDFAPLGWGRRLAIFQRAAGLILATLFTLALKRRFKR